MNKYLKDFFFSDSTQEPAFNSQWFPDSAPELQANSQGFPESLRK